MKASNWKKNNFLLPDVLWISGFISIFFIFMVTFVDKPKNLESLNGALSWLSASAVKFTNNWLKNGVTAEKFTMLESPLSIETQNLESRSPYISYPNGTVMVTYIAARITGQDQIGAKFITLLNIAFYALDALLIAFVIYLILRYLLKIKTRKGKIFISVLLSSLWIMLPSNIYYLKVAFWSDQLVLFFTCLLLFLEILRNYASITGLFKRRAIDTLLFLTVLFGVSVDYYFWIQIFILCIINFTDSLLQKNGFVHSIKKISIYIIPALIAVGLFLLQLSQIDNWWNRLSQNASFRMGISEYKPTGFYINEIYNYITQVFGYVGFICLFAYTVGGLLLLCFLKITKKSKRSFSSTGFSDVFKISLFVILPAYIQIFTLLNHSGIHGFSVLKLNLLFVFGILLFVYIIFVFLKEPLNLLIEIAFQTDKPTKKVTFNSYAVMVAICVAFFVFVNKYPYGSYSYLSNLKDYNKVRVDPYPYELSLLVREINDYENVVFSFTQELPDNPPHAVAVSQKKVYKIATLDDINRMFPNLDSNAVLFFIINKNVEKTDDVLREEEYVVNNFKLIKEKYIFAIYSTNR